MTSKLTIPYERLSHEDGRENESLSIENQKEYLEEYAIRNSFTNFIHIADDGWSGTPETPAAKSAPFSAAGKRVSGAIPYGYLHDHSDRQKWILDEEAAPIVGRIFRSVIGRKTVSQIADELSAEGVLTPSAHWTKIGAGMPGKSTANPTRWSAATIINICKKEEYMGWKILNKTSKESYKSKKREQTASEKSPPLNL